jgi:glutamate dehydrogenase (NAD(P)+)
VPYTEAGLRTLRERGIAAHADFVCNAGGVIGYESPADATPSQVLDDVERRIGGMTAEVMAHPEGPFAGGVALAERFIRSWRGDGGMPPGPPLA